MSGIVLDTTELERRIGQRLDEALDSVRKMMERPDLDGEGPRRWLSVQNVALRIGRSRRTILDMVKVGEFPGRAVIFRGQPMWLEADVEGWMREREEAGEV